MLIFFRRLMSILMSTRLHVTACVFQATGVVAKIPLWSVTLKPVDWDVLNKTWYHGSGGEHPDTVAYTIGGGTNYIYIYSVYIYIIVITIVIILSSIIIIIICFIIILIIYVYIYIICPWNPGVPPMQSAPTGTHGIFRHESIGPLGLSWRSGVGVSQNVFLWENHRKTIGKWWFFGF